MLVNAQRGTFDPSKLKDKFKERVLQLIEDRSRAAVPGSVPNQERKGAPVVDMMDALRKSLEAARKPAQREVSSSAPKKKDKRRAK